MNSEKAAHEILELLPPRKFELVFIFLIATDGAMIGLLVVILVSTWSLLSSGPDVILNEVSVEWYEVTVLL